MMMVNMKDWEIGGFKMVQSYGGVPNWGNQGYAYMMYKTVADDLGAAASGTIACIVLDVKETYDPKTHCQDPLEHPPQETIKVITGISNMQYHTRPR